MHSIVIKHIQKTDRQKWTLMDIQMKKYEDNFAEAVMAGKLSHNGKDRRGRRGWV